MKWYGVLTFIFVIVALLGIIYLGANTDKIWKGFGEPSFISIPTSSTSIVLTSSAFGYDCDKNYNKYLKLFDYVDGTESIASQSPERMAIYELEEKLMDNECI